MKKLLLATALVFGACSPIKNKNRQDLQDKLVKEFVLPHKTADFYSVDKDGYYIISTDSKDKVHLTIAVDRNRKDAYKYDKKSVFISNVIQRDESKLFDKVSKYIVLYLEKGDELGGWLESSGELDPKPGAISKLKMYSINPDLNRAAFAYVTRSIVETKSNKFSPEDKCKVKYSFDTRYAKLATPRDQEADALIKIKKDFDACMNKTLNS